MGVLVVGAFGKKKAETGRNRFDGSAMAEPSGDGCEQILHELISATRAQGIELSNILDGKAAKVIRRLEVSPTTLESKRRIVAGYLDEELRHWYEDSSEVAWVANAAFYRAIIDELEGRGYLFA